MNGLQGWCAVLDVRPHGESPPVGKAFAMVANRSSNGHSLASECIKSNEGDEEIIKVYLKARAEGSVNHDEHVNQLKSEVRYIQEARSSLKKLREDLSSKLESRQGDKQPAQVTRKGAGFLCCPLAALVPSLQEEDYLGDDVEKMRQTARRLFTRLQEAESRHRLEKAAFEVSVPEAERRRPRCPRARGSARRPRSVCRSPFARRVTRPPALLQEHGSLLLKMKEGEAELARLRSTEGDKLAEQDR
uniref:Uncharacterized protein n=1 Tax=Nothoprocta perdicaria TaxID=30464 RepID=A0A8C6Z1V8_NOTPE